MSDTTYQQLGQQIGELVDEKNAAYGSSFSKCGDFMKLLYPNGLKPEDYPNALLLTRIFDKQMRIATDADALGESPFQDIAGYGLLGAKIQLESKSRCGSARPGAEEELREQNVSAVPDAPKPTTTSAEPQSAQPSPQPSTAPSSATSNDTAAHAAAKSSRTSVAARAKIRIYDSNILHAIAIKPTSRSEMVALVEQVRHRNSLYGCGVCTEAMQAEWMSGAWGGNFLYFCSRECRADFHRALQGGTA